MDRGGRLREWQSDGMTEREREEGEKGGIRQEKRWTINGY